MSKKRRFSVHMEIDFELELNAAVLSARQLKGAGECVGGDIGTVNGAVEHIAYNMVANHLGLESIDGFANLPNRFAKEGTPSWLVEVEELP